ncbi:hypothetical protein FQA39_LY10940 [Lamprigera yunnana]|nr:hypothetical protein FQA39_LY10940 [Lamprigera yunnana]
MTRSYKCIGKEYEMWATVQGSIVTEVAPVNYSENNLSTIATIFSETQSLSRTNTKCGISKDNEGGSNQNLILFIRGNAISGAPNINGINQFSKPPIILGMSNGVKSELINNETDGNEYVVAEEESVSKTAEDVMKSAQDVKPNMQPNTSRYNLRARK